MTLTLDPCDTMTLTLGYLTPVLDSSAHDGNKIGRKKQYSRNTGREIVSMSKI